MTSIRRRLSVGLALSLIGVFILLGMGVSLSFRMLTEGYIVSRLEHDAESLLTSLAIMPHDAQPILHAERINPVYEKPFSGHYYIVTAGDTELRSRSLWDQTLQVPAVAVGESIKLRLQGPQRQLLLMQVSAFRKSGQTVTIAVAEDLTPIRHEVREFQLRYALFGIAALVLLLVLQRSILTRGLRPLDSTCREIGELERGAREQLSENVPHEMQPVVRKINHLLTVLQQRLARSRNAMGNLAHALKTPLTLLSQLADRDEHFRSASEAATARELVERIRSLTERELKRARLAGPTVHAVRLDLHEELTALIGVLRQLYRERDLDIALDMPSALSMNIDREDLHEIIGNLLDNACKWARTQVRIQVRTQARSAAQPDTGVGIDIEDDGPGRTTTELESLYQRGVRVDEGNVPGHGLGLAIVQDIVGHYGGELTLGRSESLGGFSVRVWLPAAQQH